MSQANVERIIGLLATDEARRRRFTQDPQAAIRELIEGGYALTSCEWWALTTLDPDHLARFAEGIDGRLQKSDLKGGAS